MKKIILLGALLVSSFSLANNINKNEFNRKAYVIEYRFVDNTCQARFCWQTSETTRECTDWQDVPCNTTITVDTRPKDAEQVLN